MDDDQLYARAMNIQEGKARGLWVPIMQHLAIRQHPDAMVALANWYDEVGNPAAATDQFNSDNLLRRAWRKGCVHAAQNMAMNCFNANDLAGFRLWARRAARLGDAQCANSIRRFETRLPHRNARKVGRLRPETKRDIELFMKG